MRRRTWMATHRITFRTSLPDRPDVWEVMLVANSRGAGPAYTKPEWDSQSPPAWKRYENNDWTSYGNANPNGENGKVTVRKLRA